MAQELVRTFYWLGVFPLGGILEQSSGTGFSTLMFAVFPEN